MSEVVTRVRLGGDSNLTSDGKDGSTTSVLATARPSLSITSFRRNPLTCPITALWDGMLLFSLEISGDVTKPALFERICQQSGLTVIVDDVVVNDNSRAYQQFIRSNADCTTRAVCNKSRCPLSSSIFTVELRRLL